MTEEKEREKEDKENEKPKLKNLDEEKKGIEEKDKGTSLRAKTSTNTYGDRESESKKSLFVGYNLYNLVDR